MSIFANFLPRKGAVYGGAAILLGLMPHPFSLTTPAAEPRSVQAPDLTPRDWLLTNQARRAILKDEQLAPLRLGVTVKDRVATIWGTIPSDETAKRADELLRKISGIAVVMNDCRIVRSDPIPEAVAAAVKNARSDGDETTTVARPDTTPTSRVVAKPAVPDLFPPKAPPATLLPPVPTSNDVRLEDWERVRRSEKRFQDVMLEMQNGVVRIHGNVTRMKDAWDLAEKLNNLASVKQVIMGTVTER